MDTKLKINGYGTGFKILAFLICLLGFSSIFQGVLKGKDVLLYVSPDSFIKHYYYYNDYHLVMDAISDLYLNPDAELSEVTKNIYKKQITDSQSKGYSYFILDNNNTIIGNFSDDPEQNNWQEVLENTKFINVSFYSYDESKQVYKVYVVFSNENFDKIKQQLKSNSQNGKYAFYSILTGLFLFFAGLVWVAILAGKKAKNDVIVIGFWNRIYNDILFACFAGIYGFSILAVGIYIFETPFSINYEVIIVIAIVCTFMLATVTFWMVHSFAVHIKLKQFFKHTLAWAVISSVFKIIKRFFIGLQKSIKRICFVISEPSSKIVNKTVKRKLIFATTIILIVALINSIIIAIISMEIIEFTVFWIPFSLAVFIFVPFWFVLKQLSELVELKKGIAEIRRGNLLYKIPPCKIAEINQIADDINHIGDGLQSAVKTATISEKMKTELITNVSHDLKTPLTSIISYIDLLSKEENLSSEATDYIAVLKSKSQRLKNIISDLFDLSKGTSGNAEITIERLDIAKLIVQTLADMEDAIISSGHIIRQSLLENEVFINADGKRLYRVFQNIFDNALKYALPNTRIFVNLNIADGKAVATVQNIACYEMDFSENEILERFTRGDKSRASDGAGLGLSIADTFTKLCGGNFSIKIDGDQFKVIIEFEVCPLVPNNVFDQFDESQQTDQ